MKHITPKRIGIAIILIVVFNETTYHVRKAHNNYICEQYNICDRVPRWDTILRVV